MIRIFKNNDIKVVTKGVYDNLYKPLGYKQMVEEKKVKVVSNERVVEKTTTDNTNKESSKINKRNRGE